MQRNAKKNKTTTHTYRTTHGCRSREAGKENELIKIRRNSINYAPSAAAAATASGAGRNSRRNCAGVHRVQCVQFQKQTDLWLGLWRLSERTVIDVKVHNTTFKKHKKSSNANNKNEIKDCCECAHLQCSFSSRYLCVVSVEMQVLRGNRNLLLSLVELLVWPREINRVHSLQCVCSLIIEVKPREGKKYWKYACNSSNLQQSEASFQLRFLHSISVVVIVGNTQNPLAPDYPSVAVSIFVQWNLMLVEHADWHADCQEKLLLFGCEKFLYLFKASFFSV